MEFNVVITELENDRNWLINEREDILSELAELKKRYYSMKDKLR